MAKATLRTFEEDAAFHAAALELLKSELQQAGSRPRGVLISGGRTPLPIYDRLAQETFVLGKSTHVGFSDERHVPVESAESNYGAAQRMLHALKAREDQVLRVHPELPLEAAAQKYEQDLRAFLDAGGVFTLALLGMGADGHTCSLFTQEDLDRAQGRLAIAVRRPAPPHRVSVTPQLLAQVERVVFLLSGADKNEVVEALLSQPDTLVAGRAVAQCSRVEVWRV